MLVAVRSERKEIEERRRHFASITLSRRDDARRDTRRVRLARAIAAAAATAMLVALPQHGVRHVLQSLARCQLRPTARACARGVDDERTKKRDRRVDQNYRM